MSIHSEGSFRANHLSPVEKWKAWSVQVKQHNHRGARSLCLCTDTPKKKKKKKWINYSNPNLNINNNAPAISRHRLEQLKKSERKVKEVREDAEKEQNKNTRLWPVKSEIYYQPTHCAIGLRSCVGGKLLVQKKKKKKTVISQFAWP